MTAYQLGRAKGTIRLGLMEKYTGHRHEDLLRPCEKELGASEVFKE